MRLNRLIEDLNLGLLKRNKVEVGQNQWKLLKLQKRNAWLNRGMTVSLVTVLNKKCCLCFLLTNNKLF